MTAKRFTILVTLLALGLPQVEILASGKGRGAPPPKPPMKSSASAQSARPAPAARPTSPVRGRLPAPPAGATTARPASPVMGRIPAPPATANRAASPVMGRLPAAPATAGQRPTGTPSPVMGRLPTGPQPATVQYRGLPQRSNPSQNAGNSTFMNRVQDRGTGQRIVVGGVRGPNGFSGAANVTPRNNPATNVPVRSGARPPAATGGSQVRPPNPVMGRIPAPPNNAARPPAAANRQPSAVRGRLPAPPNAAATTGNRPPSPVMGRIPPPPGTAAQSGARPARVQYSGLPGQSTAPNVGNATFMNRIRDTQTGQRIILGGQTGPGGFSGAVPQGGGAVALPPPPRQ